MAMFSKTTIINLLLSSLFCLTISNKIYLIENKKHLSWMDANIYCSKRGMHLLTMKTKNDMDYLKEYIRKEYGRVVPSWLDAYKIHGQYTWSTSNEKITKFFWHEGEPNDKSGNENCIHTWVEQFDWNDNDCEGQIPFICELQV